MADQKKLNWRLYKESLRKNDEKFAELLENTDKPDSLTEEQFRNFIAGIDIARRQMQSVAIDLKYWCKEDFFSQVTAEDFHVTVNFTSIQKQAERLLSTYENNLSYVHHTENAVKSLEPVVVYFFRDYLKLQKVLAQFRSKYYDSTRYFFDDQDE